MVVRINRRQLAGCLCGALVAIAAHAARGAPVAGRTPRASITFSPDGKLVAVAGYRTITLLEVGTGRTVGTLSGHAGAVTGVAFSPDGKTLATSGGQPGRAGEIRLWNVRARTSRQLSGIHTDVVYSVSWSPDGKRLAASSYDRLVSLWDVGSGTGRPLKDHTDAVYSVAFSPDGQRLASVSGDRTLKIWDVASGKRTFTLSDSTAELYSVAFSPSGSEVVAGGVDKMLRKWSLTPTAGILARSAFAHEGPVLRVAYTPDGSGIVTSSEDRSVRLWDAATLSEKRIYDRQPDWALGLAVSPDGTLLGVSRYNGTMAVYEVATGRLRPFFEFVPAAATGK